MWFDIVLIFILLALLILVVPSVTRGAPYVPTNMSKVERMVSLAASYQPKIMADLGSGDGRIIMAMARAGIEAHGYETSPLLVYFSRKKIREHNLQDKAFVHWKNFWHTDFSKFDLITVFGITRIMPRLEEKLQGELRPGSKILSYVFKFPNWPAAGSVESIYLYEKV